MFSRRKLEIPSLQVPYIGNVWYRYSSPWEVWVWKWSKMGSVYTDERGRWWGVDTRGSQGWAEMERVCRSMGTVLPLIPGPWTRSSNSDGCSCLGPRVLLSRRDQQGTEAKLQFCCDMLSWKCCSGGSRREREQKQDREREIVVMIPQWAGQWK